MSRVAAAQDTCRGASHMMGDPLIRIKQALVQCLGRLTLFDSSTLVTSSFLLLVVMPGATSSFLLLS